MSNRTTVKTLNGKRNPIRTMDYHLSRPELEHPLPSVECECWAKISDFLRDGVKQTRGYYPEKISVLALKEKHMKGELVILKLFDFQKLVRQASGGYNAVT